MATVAPAPPLAGRLYAPARSDGPYPDGTAVAGWMPLVAGTSVRRSAKQVNWFFFAAPQARATGTGALAVGLVTLGLVGAGLAGADLVAAGFAAVGWTLFASAGWVSPTRASAATAAVAATERREARPRIRGTRSPRGCLPLTPYPGVLDDRVFDVGIRTVMHQAILWGPRVAHRGASARRFLRQHACSADAAASCRHVKISRPADLFLAHE